MWHSCPTTRNEAVGMSGKQDLANLVYLHSDVLVFVKKAVVYTSMEHSLSWYMHWTCYNSCQSVWGYHLNAFDLVAVAVAEDTNSNFIWCEVGLSWQGNYKGGAVSFEFLALLKWQVGCQVQERKRERERETHAHEMRVKREVAKSCVFHWQ